MNLLPLGTNVVLQMQTKEEVTASGIYIPSSSQTITNRATVIAVGNEVEHVGIGNDVLFENINKNKVIEHDGQTLLVVKEENIMAVVS